MGISSTPRRAPGPFLLACLSLVAALSSAACEPRVSVGALCSVSSDCPSPYVCAAGRCRVECSEARDCPFPLECLVVGNASGCRVTEDGSCPRGAMDCAEGLDCIEGRCTQPCTDHDECAAAQTCDDAGGCERLPVEGACDLLSGVGCADGQTCTPSGCSSLGVTAAMAGELHAPCSRDTCAPGLTCADGRCLRWCEFERDGTTGAYTDRPRTSCGVGSRCAGAGYSGGEPPPEGRGYCTQPCDPSERGEAAGCPGDMTCGLLFFNDSSVASGCYPPLARVSCATDPTADGCRHRPCWMGYGCEQGIDCTPELTNTSMGGRRCLGRCLDDADCGSDERCYLDAPARVFDDARSPIVVGTCLPTCGIDPATTTTTRGCPSSTADGSVSCDVHNGASAGVDWAYCMPSCASDSDCFAALTCDEAHGICTPRGGYSP